MQVARVLLVCFCLSTLVACGGGSSGGINPPPNPGVAPVSLSLRDMPPMGVTVLSFQVTVTGAVMQPGSVSLVNSPMTLEMTQLQTMATYLGTIFVPAGNYTGMTITLANPRMTFLNDSGGMMMMGSANCANGEICVFSPTMVSTSATISGSPFPLNVQANTPLSMQMDFDVMNSMQPNLSVNPSMTSMMQQPMQGSSAFDAMDDIVGQVGGVNASNNQFTLQVLQGPPSMTIGVDSNTMFEDFNTIGNANSLSGMAAGQIVEVNMQLMSGGTLHATKVRFENNNAQELDGMIVAINSPTQADMIVTGMAPAVQGVNIGDVVRMNLQAGTSFDIDDHDMPVSGMSFAGVSDMMVGQVVQTEPMSVPSAGTPAQVNVNHVRLMKAWFTATVASKIDASTFTVNNLPGLFAPAGINSAKIMTSSGTEFTNISGVAALNVGDTVSLRGAMFMASGNATMIASKVQRR